jgi:O-antigen ligase
MEVVRDAALVLIFVGTLGLSTRKKDHLQKWTMYILTCAAVIICVIGIPVFILQPFDRFVGAFFDPRYATDYFPNACAGFLLLAWPIALITIKNNRWKMFVMGLLIACLFLTFSRAAWLIFSLQLAILWWRTERIHLRTIMQTGAIALLLIVTLSMARSITFPLLSPIDRVSFSDASGSLPIRERIDFWKSALHMTTEKPLLGWGPQSFQFVAQRFQTVPLSTGDDPHNFLLKLAAERGVLTAFLFLMIVFVSFMPFFGFWKTKNDFVKNALALGILGLFLHTFFDRDMVFFGIALSFWICLGLLSESSAKKPQQWMYLVAVVLMITTVEVVQIRQNGELMLTNTQTLLNLHDPESAAKELQQSYLSKNGEDARAWLLLADSYAAADIPTEHPQHDLAVDAYDHAMETGGMNYPEILQGILVELESPGEFEERRADIDRIFASFADAVIHNYHYTALSNTPEVLDVIIPELIALEPKEKERLKKMQTELKKASDYWRSESANKPKGKLW